MPHYALVIEEPVKAKKARAKMVEDAFKANGMVAVRAKRLADELEAQDTVEAGDLWTTADMECPLGNTNCRNCGDPEFEESCKASGHCNGCGRSGNGGHGIAPDSVLVAKGIVLKEIPVPQNDEMWDKAQRKFVKRQG